MWCFVNTIKNCHVSPNGGGGDISEEKPGDIGFFEGTLDYLAIPESSDYDCIEDDTFNGCTELEEVFIPSNVSGIWDDGFRGCPKLKKIVVAKTEDSLPGKPWGAPDNCVVVFDPSAKPRD